MRQFVFRFDVDTIKCIKVGVPRILQLQRHLGIKFTFFVNFGRAIAYRVIFNKLINNIPNNVIENTPYKLSAKRKLGNFFFLITALLNPKVGASSLYVLRQIRDSGNEIGLHGGKNHSLWQLYGKGWSKGKIKEEINWALNLFEENDLPRPSGFASPGWSGSRNLHLVLEELGFLYVSDNHAPDSTEIYPAEKDVKLLHIPVNIAGQGGVGYIESLVAKGLSNEDIVNDFINRLGDKEIAVVYDHPYFAGVECLEIIPKLIEAATKLGFEIRTMKEVVSSAK